MAKSKSKRGPSSTHHSVANSQLLRLTVPAVHLPTPVQSVWDWIGTDVEDRRLYHPEGQARPARSTTGQRHRLRVPLAPRSAWNAIGFENPKKVMICIRRKRRREVMHALKLTGKGARGKKHRNFHSNTWCK